jgi:dTDP-glucose pyrophosphorylase
MITTCLDTGKFDSLFDSSEFVRAIKTLQGQKKVCVEEVPYRMVFINASQLIFLENNYQKRGYGEF